MAIVISKELGLSTLLPSLVHCIRIILLKVEMSILPGKENDSIYLCFHGLLYILHICYH